MNTPFSYGKIVDYLDFTGRLEETSRLTKNFQSLTNTILISPRGWGKSSLVARAIKETAGKKKDVLFVNMNLFKCETPRDFYDVYARTIMEGVSSSTESLLSNAKEIISRLLPNPSLSDALGQYEIAFGVNVKDNPEEEDILDIPQQIATKKKKKIIVCIDEFQQIGGFADTLKFQKILRNHWQQHKDVAYILYGSKKQMMLNIFEKNSSPFYQFGDTMVLDKIANEEWKKFIVGRFKDTDKSITVEMAGYLAEQVENHPYYVQQLAQYSWLRTEKACTKDVVDAALQAMLYSLNPQFVNLMDTLTEKQRSFLCAVCDGVKTFSSTETLQRYRLGTSGNIRIIKNALLNRDIIDVSGKTIQIQDPLLKRWILQEYAKL